MCTSLVLQSFYFIYQMVRIIKKKLVRYGEMRQKSVQFEWLEECPKELEKLSFYNKKESNSIF